MLLDTTAIHDVFYIHIIPQMYKQNTNYGVFIRLISRYAYKRIKRLTKHNPSRKCNIPSSYVDFVGSWDHRNNLTIKEQPSNNIITILFDTSIDLLTRLKLCTSYILPMSDLARIHYYAVIITDALTNEDYKVDEVVEMLQDHMTDLYFSFRLSYKTKNLMNIVQLVKQTQSFNQLIHVINTNIPRKYIHSGCLLVKIAYYVDRKTTLKALRIEGKETELGFKQEIKLSSGVYFISRRSNKFIDERIKECMITCTHVRFCRICDYYVESNYIRTKTKLINMES